MSFICLARASRHLTDPIELSLRHVSARSHLLKVAHLCQSSHPFHRWYSQQVTPLEGRLRSGLKDAMRQKDTFSSTLIRSILSDLTYADKGQKSTSASPTDREDVIVSVIRKAIKSREASKQAYLEAAQPSHDLAAREEREINALRHYLPAELSQDALDAMAQQCIDQMIEKGSDGKIMGAVISHVRAAAGNRATGKAISDTVKRLLSSR